MTTKNEIIEKLESIQTDFDSADIEFDSDNVRLEYFSWSGGSRGVPEYDLDTNEVSIDRINGFSPDDYVLVERVEMDFLQEMISGLPEAGKPVIDAEELRQALSNYFVNKTVQTLHMDGCLHNPTRSYVVDMLVKIVEGVVNSKPEVETIPVDEVEVENVD